MSMLREAAQQALWFTLRDFKSLRDFEAARAVLQDALRAALTQDEQAMEAERENGARAEREACAQVCEAMAVERARIRQALSRRLHGLCRSHPSKEQRMTQEDILRMAREAGLISRHGCRETASDEMLERFAALVAGSVAQAEAVCTGAGYGDCCLQRLLGLVIAEVLV